MSFIKERPQQYQVQNNPISITLADTPYTVPSNISEVNVNTAGGNVRVNLPNSARQIKVNKTSSDSYLVTLYVAGTQIGEIAGELSSVTVESGQITKDEPWYPYDMIVEIAGVSGDGGEIVAKNKFGKCLSSSWRGIAGTDDAAVIQVVVDLLETLAPYSDGKQSGSLVLDAAKFSVSSAIQIPTGLHVRGRGIHGTFVSPSGSNDVFQNKDSTNGNMFIHISDLSIGPAASGVHVGNIGINIRGAVSKWIWLDHLMLWYLNSHAISVDYGYQYRISDCSIKLNTGSGVYAGPNVENGLLIQNSTFESNDYNVQILGGNTHRVESCHLESSTLDSIYLAGGYSYILNNYIYNSDRHGIQSIGPYNTISGNKIYDAANNGLLLANASACHVVDNLISSIGATGINVTSNSVGSIFERNILSGISGINSFSAYSGCNSHEIDGNNFSTKRVYIESNNNTVKNNRILGSLVNSGSGNIIRSNYGYLTESSGSSTGTGTEDPIPHGLAAIPTGCRAWITYLVGSRYVTEFVPFDATNIYPTVTSSLAYTWGIGAV